MKTRYNFFAVLVLFSVTVFGNGIGRGEEFEDESSGSSDLPDEVIRGEEGGAYDKTALEEEPELEAPGLKQYLFDTLYHFGFIWAGRFFYIRNKEGRIFDTSFSKWIDNISDVPEFDDGDSFKTNLVLHPIFGAEYYLYYRARGHTVWASALGSFIQSALFEYAVEGLVETPSGQDLIFTPGVGVPMGIVLENLSDWLVKRDNQFARLAGHIVNPTRIFIKNRKFGVFNPLTGAFAFQGPLSVTPNKAKALELSYPFFFESPIPVGRVGTNVEVVKLDRELGGEFIFYSIRLEFASSNNRFGLYFEIPYGGVNNATFNGESLNNRFEFGNVTIGGKLLVIDSERLSIAGGLEVLPPTALDDNLGAIEPLVNYGRDFPAYLLNAATVTPYISAALRRDKVSLLGNLGIDLIFSAEKLERDAFEVRIKYGTALGLRTALPASPALFVEFNGYTFLSDRKVKRTDTFITSGLRFGKRYSPGFGLQIPINGPTADIANASFIVDFQARF